MKSSMSSPAEGQFGRWGTLIKCTIVTGALALGQGPAATAAPSPGRSAPGGANPGAATAQDFPCGYSVYGNAPIQWAHWRNCSPYNDFVYVDRILWPDRYECVGAGSTERLGDANGRVGDVRGARLSSKLCDNP
jgi:hypothetical protein